MTEVLALVGAFALLVAFTMTLVVRPTKVYERLYFLLIIGGIASMAAAYALKSA